MALFDANFSARLSDITGTQECLPPKIEITKAENQEQDGSVAIESTSKKQNNSGPSHLSEPSKLTKLDVHASPVKDLMRAPSTPHVPKSPLKPPVPNVPATSTHKQPEKRARTVSTSEVG